jgi:hypothetical protein
MRVCVGSVVDIVNKQKSERRSEGGELCALAVREG